MSEPHVHRWEPLNVDEPHRDPCSDCLTREQRIRELEAEVGLWRGGMYRSDREQAALERDLEYAAERALSLELQARNASSDLTAAMAVVRGLLQGTDYATEVVKRRLNVELRSLPAHMKAEP